MYETTAAQARAIRNADALCFDHGHTDYETGIRAIRRADRSATGFEETVRVPVESSRIHNYGTDSGPFACFAMAMYAQHDDVVRTLTRRIKAGSQIALNWTRNNASPVTDQAGIVVDYLDVTVQNGKTADTFRVATFIGRDNSARMIRTA